MTARDGTSAARVLLALALMWAAALAAAGCSDEARVPVAPESAGGSTPVLLDDDDDDDEGEFEPGEVLVRPAPGVGISTINARYDTRTLESLQGQRLFRLAVPEGRTVRGLLREMRADPDIALASTNARLEAPEADGSSMGFADPSLRTADYRDQEALDRIRASDAWRHGKGAGVRVAVLDTGIAAGHPVLAGRIAAGGRDFVDDDADPADVGDGRDNDGDGLVDEARGHGTFAAGLVLSVAPDARILPIRVLNADGVGTAFDILQGLEYARARGARVANMSFGMSGAPEAFEEALEDAADDGIVLVASAGNRNLSSPAQFPAREPDVLGVAATNRNDRKAAFSNYGDWVGVAAPGVGLVVPYPGGGYGTWSGTSFASALTSGAAAVLVSVRPGAGSSRVRTAIRRSAAPLEDALLTCGRLDVLAAVRDLVNGGVGGGGDDDDDDDDDDGGDD